MISNIGQFQYNINNIISELEVPDTILSL